MKFKRQNKPASSRAVSEFLQRRGIQLPADYVEFLTTINGGYTGGLDSYALLRNGIEMVVQQILGLTSYSDDSIATKHFTNFSNFTHDRMLDVAYTPNGDSIVMDLREATYGKIYLRAHDSPPNDPISIDDSGFEDDVDYEEASLFHPVANSWTEFVAMLGPAPPIED